MSTRLIVDGVLGRDMTREIWSASYDKVLPVSLQDFDLSAVLPAVFYMFRFGQRRGQGKFLKIFGSEAEVLRERKQTATIERVASELAKKVQFEGFEGDAEQAILGDLLLCFCLENVKRAMGRKEQIQRVAPAHYMSSWVDLPDKVTNLRYVPEMIVAMLADQESEFVRQNQEGDKTWFAVGRGFEDNVLLREFNRGIIRRGELGSRTSDHFDENEQVGLDQLLMIRLAQQLGEAPDKIRGGEKWQISNQRPIAEKVAREFSDDIRRFVRSYADIIPRHAFVELMESCISVGMATIITSVLEIVFEWAETGTVRKKCEQNPTYLFVDCSNGVDRFLRGLSEQSFNDFMRKTERFPIVLMALRLLDWGARYDPDIKKIGIKTRPYATEWLNMLGDLLHERREEARAIHYDFARKSEQLAEKLEEDHPEIAQMLRNTKSQPNPVWRLSEALTYLQGRSNTIAQVIKLIDSSLMVNRPNGLSLKRSVIRASSIEGNRTRTEVRSIVFTDSVLDYLVHLHLIPSGNKGGTRHLSFKDFVHILHNRYGFCVDTAPPGLSISNELLQANRMILERRLRDLGLLVGVNDAETMKRLRPRFEFTAEEDHEFDKTSCNNSK